MFYNVGHVRAQGKSAFLGDHNLWRWFGTVISWLFVSHPIPKNSGHVAILTVPGCMAPQIPYKLRHVVELISEPLP